MIYDRTLTDVNNSKRIISEKVQKFIELTEEELEVLERGTITVNTLNRIENKQAEIKSLLNDMGYFNTPVTNKTWKYSDIFSQNDLERLVNNNLSLKDAFYVLADSPTDAIAKYHYKEINSIEKILFDISQNISYTKDKYRRCGNFNCGG
jgi:hypothetical protein